MLQRFCKLGIERRRRGIGAGEEGSAPASVELSDLPARSTDLPDASLSSDNSNP
jgi:hypothetical protein